MSAAKKILILGVTASGKGSLAFELARALGAEIISIDSMKVYRRMDIGTAKPSADRRSRIPYHLIDVVEPSESFSVDRFLDLAHRAVADIEKRPALHPVRHSLGDSGSLGEGGGKSVVAVGGTAMYIKALLFGLFDAPATDSAVREKLKAEAQTLGLPALHNRLASIDPAAAQRIHPNDEKRIIRALEVYELTGRPISSLQQQWSAAGESSPESNEWFVIGLRRPKEIESSRINARVKKMLDAGLVDEVKSLLAEPKPLSQQARLAIGYAEIIDHLEGKLSFDDALEKIKINTRKFAKSQRTWFKTFRNVHWLDITPDQTCDDILSATLSLLSGK